MENRNNIFGGAKSFPTLVVSKPTKAQRVSLALSKLCSNKVKENAESITSDNGGYYYKEKYNRLLDKALKDVTIKTLPKPKKIKRSEKKDKEPTTISVDAIKPEIITEEVTPEKKVVETTEWTTPQLQTLGDEYMEIFDKPEIIYKSSSIDRVVSPSNRQTTASIDCQICDKINESERREPWIILDRTEEEPENQPKNENYRRESIIDVLSNAGNGSSERPPEEKSVPVQSLLAPKVQKKRKSKKKMPKVNLENFAEFYVVNTTNDWSFF